MRIVGRFAVIGAAWAVVALDPMSRIKERRRIQTPSEDA
jgi:hypothetical protein